jgi:hypothetical protein
MKALSLTQPWATLVILGEKRIETRSWNSYHRGPLAIHAAKTLPAWARSSCTLSPFREVLLRHGIPHPSALPLGAIIGTVEMHGSYEFHHPDEPTFVPCSEHERAFGDFTAGRYGFLLRDARVIEPIPCRGSLGLWDVPEEIARRIVA